MKRTLLALALATATLTSAHAEVFATMKNKAGGELILMDEPAGCAKGHRIIARASTGDFVRGCWLYTEGYIVAVYEDGDEMLYTPDSLVLSPKYRERYERRNAPKPAVRDL